MNDRTYKYFFIAENYDKILNEEQKAFLRFVTSNKSSGALANRISKLVEEAKQNTIWRKQFMEFERYMAYSFREGEEKKAIDSSIEFLKKGIAPEIIAECEKLPLEKVLELQKQITETA